MSESCLNGETIHTFRVKMDCEYCGTQKIIEKRLKCRAGDHEIGWIRRFGCIHCRCQYGLDRTLGMAFYCEPGKYDRDQTGYSNGDKLRFIVENIDNE